MSQEFKLRFNQMRENGLTPPQPPMVKDDKPTSSQTEYDPSPVRNLCLVWLDGMSMFFNYAYLLPGKFCPGDDINEIVLNFSGYLVSLKGYSLYPLYIELNDHRPKFIYAVDPRYITQNNSGESLVVEIHVTEPS